MRSIMDLEKIARWRLYNQRLTSDGFSSPAAVLRWLGAVQAQEFSPA